MDVTGAPSADPGHRSATPVAVATLWGIQRGTRQVGAAPVTVLPTPTIRTHLPLGKGSDDVTCPSERGPQHARARPQTSPLWGPGLPRAPGPSSVHARTPTRGSGTVPRHYYRRDTAGRPAPSPRDQGQNPGRQRHAPPSHSTLPTVFDDCTPRFKGKRRLPYPHSCAPPFLVTIKGGGGLPLDGG